MISPGKRLRELRIERLGLKSADGKRSTVYGKKATKEFVSELAGITSKSLTEIEDGKTKQPAREIIEAILDGLSKFKEIDLMNRLVILSDYGYKPPITPPSTEEGEIAQKNWLLAYHEIWYPAYLVDIIHRIWGWNKYAPRLLGFTENDSRLTAFRNADILDLIFKLTQGYISIVNREEYLPDFVSTMKSQFQPYKSEEWCISWVKKAQDRYPEFKRLWNAIPETKLKPTALGNQTPIIIRNRDDVLKFQVTAVSFANDPRFLIAQWIPVDEITAIKCLLWKKEENC